MNGEMSLATIQTTLFEERPADGPVPRYRAGRLEDVGRAELIALDTETSGPDPTSCRALIVALAADTGVSLALPVTPETVSALNPVLRSKRLAMHNAVFDIVVLARHGLDLLGSEVDCTRVMSFVINENGAHDLKSVARRFGTGTVLGFSDLDTGRGVPLEVLMDKCRVDCEQALETYMAMRSYLDERPLLRALYEDVERPLIGTFASMTLTGVPVDRGEVLACRSESEALLEKIREELQAAAGWPVDPLSDAHAARLLYGQLGLEPRVRTPTGDPSVSREALEELDHPAAEAVLRARALKSRIDGLDRLLASCTDGRVYPTYSAWSRPTGTIVPSSPFSHEEDTVPVRRIVRAGEGKAIVCVRLHDARIRLLAAASADPLLLRALETGAHPAAAVAEAAGVPETAAAAWLEALCAGKGPRSVARLAGIRQKEASAALEAIRAAVPEVFRLKEHLEEAGVRRGWVQGPTGRRRRFVPRYMARNALADVLEAAESDVFKAGLRGLRELFGPRLVLASGVTAVLEVDEREAPEIAREAARALAAAGEPYGIPAAGGAGRSWREADQNQEVIRP
jgi:DNA polymerase-1